MPTLIAALEKLATPHREALIWFIEHRGQEMALPGPLPDRVLLSTKAKGIYKPAGSKYALSIRRTIDSSYADVEPELQPDGSWHYRYFQEGSNPADRDLAYTNRGLMACIEDSVPVGVFWQTQTEPQVRYRVMGLAWALKWTEDGYFTLEGLSPGGELLAPVASEAQGRSSNAASAEDARKRIVSAIVQRQGQGQFRAGLLSAYGGKCAVTGCDVSSALEAAHIVPYRGPDTNRTCNGLLLRADVHTLFDLGLIGVDSETMTIILSPVLISGHYAALNGKRIVLPADPLCRPDGEALRIHKKAAGL